jgi:hypothetical protein
MNWGKFFVGCTCIAIAIITDFFGIVLDDFILIPSGILLIVGSVE